MTSCIFKKKKYIVVNFEWMYVNNKTNRNYLSLVFKDLGLGYIFIYIASWYQLLWNLVVTQILMTVLLYYD